MDTKRPAPKTSSRKPLDAARRAEILAKVAPLRAARLAQLRGAAAEGRMVTPRRGDARLATAAGIAGTAPRYLAAAAGAVYTRGLAGPRSVR